MKISSIQSYIPKKNNLQTKTMQQNNSVVSKSCNTIPFKSIYIEGITYINEKGEGIYPAKFLLKDSLLLNRIAQDYPNQDCFISRGYMGYPALEFREKPRDVQIFDSAFPDNYKITVERSDKEYPCEPLILYDDSLMGFFLGLPFDNSLNPSLAYTVKAGYELHKVLLRKKEQIKEEIGRSDSYTIGSESLIKKAHEAIRDVELAVTRHLLVSALKVHKDNPTGEQLYKSNYLKVQSALESERQVDLLTSVAKQPSPLLSDLNKEDICEYAIRKYPNKAENEREIPRLLKYLEVGERAFFKKESSS